MVCATLHIVRNKSIDGSIYLKARLAAGLTQQELAKLANATQTQISEIENGKRIPFPETRDRLANVLGVDPASLYAGYRVGIDEPPHGTAGGYTNHGCRCDDCRRAFAVMSRAHRNDPDHPERAMKHRSRARCQQAIKTGRLIPQPCEVCESLYVQAHHEDYEYPFKVNWLCAKHHGEIEGKKMISRSKIHVVGKIPKPRYGVRIVPEHMRFTEEELNYSLTDLESRKVRIRFVNAAKPPRPRRFRGRPRKGETPDEAYARRLAERGLTEAEICAMVPS